MNFPYILDVPIVFLSGKVAFDASTDRQDVSVPVKIEDARILGEATNDCSDRRLNWGLITRSDHEPRVFDRLIQYVPRGIVVRWVGDSIVIGIAETEPVIADEPDIGADL